MDAWTWGLAATAGFGAGLLDSIVGGGGLIMTPAMVNLFPEWAILNIIATQRTSSIAGTSVAAWNYFRHVSLPWPLVLAACGAALPASALGAMLAKRTDPLFLKWLILGMCVALAIYTFMRKDLGQTHAPRFSGRRQWVAAALFCRALVAERASWRPDPAVLRAQAVMGRDLLARSLAFQACFVSAAAVAARFGAAAVAAHQVVLQLWSFLALVLDSLAIAAQSLVGAALGAGDPGRARSVAWAARWSRPGTRWRWWCPIPMPALRSCGWMATTCRCSRKGTTSVCSLRAGPPCSLSVGRPWRSGRFLPKWR